MSGDLRHESESQPAFEFDPHPHGERLAAFLDDAVDRLKRGESVSPDEAFPNDPALAAEAGLLLEEARLWLDAVDSAAESSGIGLRPGDVLAIAGDAPAPPLPGASPKALAGSGGLETTPCSINGLLTTLPRLTGSGISFEIVKKLGKGGFGEVYLARDRHVPHQFAVKMLKPRVSGQDLDDALTALRQEAATLFLMRHPNILPIHHWFETEQGPCLTMHYVEGGSLDRRLHGQKPLPWAEATEIVLDVAEGLLEVHSAGILHRDIKPPNILWDAKNQTALLADFGVAARLRDSRGFAGTPLYAAPELFHHAGQASSRSDVYSLAVTLFELVVGQRPFAEVEQIFFGLPDDDLRLHAIPEAIEGVIRRGMAPRLADRPDVPEFIAMLTAALHGSLADDLATPADTADAPSSSLLRVRLSREKPPGSNDFHELRHKVAVLRGANRAKPKHRVCDHVVNGDTVRVEVEAAAPGWLALLNLSPDGSTTLLHPASDSRGVQSDRTADQKWSLDIEMDDKPGEERFVFAWARDPNDLAIDKLQRIAAGLGGAAIGGRRGLTRGAKAICHALRPSARRDLHVIVASMQHKEA